MKIKAMLLALFVAGLIVSVAIAQGPPPGKGKNTSATAPTTTNGKKTWICHRTGSAKKPYRKISVSNSALPAHRRHGDIVPAPEGPCPTTRNGTTTTTTTANP